MAGPQIVCTGFTLTGNKGGAAVIDGACRAIRRQWPEARIQLLSSAPRDDGPLAPRYRIELVDARLTDYALAAPLRGLAWRMLHSAGLDVPCLLDDPILKACRQAQVFVDLSGISFTDDMSWRSSLKHVMRLLPPILLGGPPIVKFPHAAGPLRRWWNRALGRWCLRRVEQVLARGAVSAAYLRRLGACRRLQIRADTAFLMPPSDRSRVEAILADEGIPLDRRPLVGVSASFVMHRKSAAGDLNRPNRYERVLAELIDHVQESTGAHILFVPHARVRGPGPAEAPGPAVERSLLGLSRLDEDDGWVARVIRSQLRHPEKTYVLNGDYPAEDLKGIIACCDAYIASRYHAMVAALSSGVPTLAVGWSHKYREVLAMFGQGERMCGLGQMEPATLKAMFDRLWRERDQVAAALAQHLEAVQASALACGEAIGEVLRGARAKAET